MQVRVRLFATLKDLTGKAEVELELPPTGRVADLLAEFFEQYPRTKDYKRALLVAVNRDYAEQETPLKEGDEIALFPPVSGG